MLSTASSIPFCGFTTTMYSWMSRLPVACAPPLMRFAKRKGVLGTNFSGKNSSRRSSHTSIFFAYANAFAPAMEIPRATFPPILFLFVLPSKRRRNSSRATREEKLFPFIWARIHCTAACASEKLNTFASRLPVLAPEGICARNRGKMEVASSTSMVAFPRESRIFRTLISWIFMQGLLYYVERFSLQESPDIFNGGAQNPFSCGIDEIRPPFYEGDVLLIYQMVSCLCVGAVERNNICLRKQILKGHIAKSFFFCEGVVGAGI